MKENQKYSPKYWVVHDKKSDDIYIDTAHKDMNASIDLFIANNKVTPSEFFGNEDLECVLVEIVKVNL